MFPRQLIIILCNQINTSNDYTVNGGSRKSDQRVGENKPYYYARFIKHVTQRPDAEHTR